MESIEIESHQGIYSVIFLKSIEEVLDFVANITGGVVIIDQNVANLYPNIERHLHGSMPLLPLDATENQKSWAGVSKIISFLQQNGCSRRNSIIAIGGGIIQDIASFAAHIYYRGINFIFVPTTLLSMSDSCIGSKVGINFNYYKNQLGFYHAPGKVYVCPQFLRTLKENDIRSGYGEIFKLSLTGPNSFWNELVSNLTGRGFSGDHLKRFIELSLDTKKYYIERDEFDKSIRRLLNYGHTFGHALETITQYEVPHGLAIVWGLDLANWISTRTGRLGDDEYELIHKAAKEFFAYSVSTQFSSADLLTIMKRDKKADGDKISLILMNKPGDLQIVEFSLDETLGNYIQEYLDVDSIIKVV